MTEIHSSRGIVLLMVLIILVFTGIITSAMLAGVRISIKLNKNRAGYQKAIYAAEAGREVGKALVEQKEGNAYGKVNINLTEETEFTIILTEHRDNTYTITSRGQYGKNEEELKIDWSDN